MRTIINILGISLILLSCGKRPPKIDYENQQSNDSLKMENLISDTTKTLVAELPILFDSIEFLIHPIGLINLNDRSSKGMIRSGSISGSSFSHSDFYISSSSENYFSGNMTNLVFENIISKEQRLLTDRVINIKTFRYLNEIYNKVNRQYLLYTIIDRDSNHDKELNYYDLESLYISNIDGSDFKKLTQNQHDYTIGKLIIKELKYYYKTIEDVNRDGLFDKQDKIHYYYIDFTKIPIEVIEYNPLKLIIE